MSTCGVHVVITIYVLYTTYMYVSVVSISTEEIVQKMSLILDSLSTTVKAEYRSRKGSRT